MNKTNENNISEYHCSGCRCRQQNETTTYSPTEDYQNNSFSNWGRNVEEDKAICIDCGVKDKKFFMDEFANGVFVCSQRLFCQDRRSWLLSKLANQKQQIL